MNSKRNYLSVSEIGGGREFRVYLSIGAVKTLNHARKKQVINELQKITKASQNDKIQHAYEKFDSQA